MDSAVFVDEHLGQAGDEEHRGRVLLPQGRGQLLEALAALEDDRPGVLLLDGAAEAVDDDGEIETLVRVQALGPDTLTEAGGH